MKETEENMCKISVIVPVYNVERYLRTCMESLVHQTLEDIEIVAVNDGSPDNSLDILKEYEQEYAPKVNVYSIENHGVSYARNYGADQAKGDYLLFVDSDDYISLDMCEVLYEKAVTDANDIVMCGKVDVYERKVGSNLEKPQKLMLSSQNFKLEERPFELCWITPFPWDKLIKRELFQKIRFPENIRFEDMACSLKMAAVADSIGVVNKPLYYYRRTTQSGFLNSFSEHTLDVVKAFQNVVDFMKEIGKKEYYQEELAYLCGRHFFFRYLNFFDNRSDDLQLKKQIINETHAFLEANFPNWRESRHIKYSYGPKIKKNLPLYENRGKLLRKVTLFHRLPPKLWRWGLQFQAKRKKMAEIWKNKAKRKAWFRSQKFMKIFHMPKSYAYTKAYETCQVDKNLILLESKHGADIAGNIFQFLKILHQPEYEKYRIMLTITEKLRPRLEELVDLYNLERIEPVVMRSNEYFCALSSAGYLITDTSFPTYFVKKDEQVYLNTWHGTPLKGMGRIVAGREYGLGNVQRNYLISDVLLYQNEFSRDIFLDDYMIRHLYPGQVWVKGYPRNSVLFNREVSEGIREENDWQDKKVIAYMPTWRGKLHEKKFNVQVRTIVRYLKKLDQYLTEDQLFFVKLHPFVSKQMDYSIFEHIYPFPSQYETYEFLSATDMLVTDYSSIMFDYAVTGKKIVLFTYDRARYLKSRGMYLDLETLEFPLADTVEELVEELQRPNAGYPKFQEQFCSCDSEQAGQEILDALLAIDVPEIHQPKERNVLVYLEGTSKKGIIEKAVRDMNELKKDGVHYYLCFDAVAVKKNTRVLAQLDPAVGYIPLQTGLNALIRERAARWLYLKLGWKNGLVQRQLERMCRRELKKYFGNAKFDQVVFYHGGSQMRLKMLGYLEGRKVCNLMEFQPRSYDTKPTYRAHIKGMITGKAGFDVYYVTPDFTKTDLYRKTQGHTNYQVVDPGDYNIHQLMEEEV